MEVFVVLSVVLSCSKVDIAGSEPAPTIRVCPGLSAFPTGGRALAMVWRQPEVL